jgi:hypothetical protein
MNASPRRKRPIQSRPRDNGPRPCRHGIRSTRADSGELGPKMATKFVTPGIFTKTAYVMECSRRRLVRQMEVPRMRWMLASLCLLVMLPTTGCSSSSKTTQGIEKGPCYPNLTCNAGLTCLSGLCVYAGPSTSTGAGVDTGVQIGTGGVDGGEGGGIAPSDAGIGGNTAATGGTTTLAPDAGPDALPDTASSANACPADSVCFKNGQALERRTV